MILRRALGDIEKRSTVLLAKGRRTQFLDKEQDARAVVRLADQLQKAILIYQVCAKGCEVQPQLTLAMADVPTTINPQPDHAVDSMFPHVTFVLKLTSCLLKVFI